MSESPEKIIHELAEPIAAQYDMFVVDVEIKQHQGTVVWVNVDSEEKTVNVDKCSKISRELDFLLDAHDVMHGSYRLNVSSPGLSKPLNDLRQYRKNTGRYARVKFKTEDGYKTEEGVLSAVTDTDVELKPDDKDSKILKIGFDEIVETKILPKI